MAHIASGVIEMYQLGSYSLALSWAILAADAPTRIDPWTSARSS
jgi:hypothetical protein